MDEYKLYKERITLYPDWWIFIVCPTSGIGLLVVAWSMLPFFTWNPKDLFIFCFTALPIFIGGGLAFLSAFQKTIMHETGLERSVFGFTYKRMLFEDVLEDWFYQSHTPRNSVALNHFYWEDKNLNGHTFTFNLNTAFMPYKFLDILYFRLDRIRTQRPENAAFLYQSDINSIKLKTDSDSTETTNQKLIFYLKPITKAMPILVGLFVVLLYSATLISTNQQNMVIYFWVTLLASCGLLTLFGFTRKITFHQNHASHQAFFKRTYPYNEISTIILNSKTLVFLSHKKTAFGSLRIPMTIWRAPHKTLRAAIINVVQENQSIIVRHDVLKKFGIRVC